MYRVGCRGGRGDDTNDSECKSTITRFGSIQRVHWFVGRGWGGRLWTIQFVIAKMVCYCLDCCRQKTIGVTKMLKTVISLLTNSWPWFYARSSRCVTPRTKKKNKQKFKNVCLSVCQLEIEAQTSVKFGYADASPYDTTPLFQCGENCDAISLSIVFSAYIQLFGFSVYMQFTLRVRTRQLRNSGQCPANPAYN